MLIVLVPLVLRASQTSPPSLAEFAPQAQRSIKQSPLGQTSNFVHDQARAFADVAYTYWQDGGEATFYDDLARERIIGVQGTIEGLPASSESHLAAFAPYEWNFVPTPDQIERNLADVICRQLAG